MSVTMENNRVSLPTSQLTAELAFYKNADNKTIPYSPISKLIGYYGDDKRFGAIFERIISKNRHQLIRIDPNLTLDQQAEIHGRHFDLIIHKMTKEVAHRGYCARSEAMLSHLEDYRRRHQGRCLVLDPPEAIACTTDRVSLHHKLQPLHISHRNEVILYPHSVILGTNSENNSKPLNKLRPLTTSSSCNSSSHILFTSPIPHSAYHSSNVTRSSTSSSPEEDIRVLLRLQEQGFRFPAIAKPGNADGSPESHEMALVFNAGGLRPVQQKLKKANHDSSIVLQQFINHDGVLHKIYCLGDKIYMGVRPSLPNINIKLKKLKKKIMKMQKNKPSPSEDRNPDEDSEDEDNYQYFGRISKDEDPAVIPQRIPSKKILKQLCSHLRCTLGMNLFGIDLITKSAEPGDEGKLEHYVIDVNYFPSYAGMPDVSASFQEYIDACVVTSTLFPFSTTTR